MTTPLRCLLALAAFPQIIARLCHADFYLADIAVMRSLSFLAGLGFCVWLVALAAEV